MDWIKLVTSICTLIGVCIAVYGINSWRRELIGKRKIELAEEVLSLFYEVCDDFKCIRCAGSSPGETDGIEKLDNESEDDWHVRKHASIILKRDNEKQTSFNKLRSLRYRFMAIFGEENTKPFNRINIIRSKIRIAAKGLERLWVKKEKSNKDEENIRKYEVVIGYGTDENDPIAKELDSIIADIEKICQNIISKGK